MPRPIHPRALALGMLVAIAAPAAALAQSDEIQVYDGGLAAPGKFNLTIHSNFTPSGQKTPAFPGGLATDKLINGVPEWALGVTNWFEAGLYLPLYSRASGSGATLDGFKLRALFAAPHADERTFFYGANFEFSVNAKHWDKTRFTSEVRPIIGWHLHPVDIIINPIVDTAYDGVKNLEFVPAMRVAYNVAPTWVLGVEEYADFGTVRKFLPTNEQSHQVYGIVGHTGGFLDVEAGVGFGLTDASDKLTLKLILSRDLN